MIPVIFVCFYSTKEPTKPQFVQVVPLGDTQQDGRCSSTGRGTEQISAPQDKVESNPAHKKQTEEENTHNGLSVQQREKNSEEKEGVHL